MIGGIGLARGGWLAVQGITYGKFLNIQTQNLAFWSVSIRLLHKIIIVKQRAAGCDTDFGPCFTC